MDIWDQFVSDDTCPVGQMLNAGRPMSSTMGGAMIDSNVIICHAARREALLEPASHPEAIQCTYLRQTETGPIDTSGRLPPHACRCGACRRQVAAAE
jgi:hypothetical protein